MTNNTHYGWIYSQTSMQRVKTSIHGLGILDNISHTTVLAHFQAIERPAGFEHVVIL